MVAIVWEHATPSRRVRLTKVKYLAEEAQALHVTNLWNFSADKRLALLICLFSHFIACGVWEAICMLDGLIRNRSSIQLTTVQADTRAEPARLWSVLLTRHRVDATYPQLGRPDLLPSRQRAPLYPY
nr:transposase [Thermosporothrix hazakensis]